MIIRLLIPVIMVADSERNAVSMTNTINSYFGAKFLSPSTGIVLNNKMDDFSIPGSLSADVPPPAPANFIRPFKWPPSSMTATNVLQGEQLEAVIGASGGSMIIAATTEVFLNYFAKGMNPLSSVMAPRYYHPLFPNVLRYENWTAAITDQFELPTETREGLQKKGHVLQSISGRTICQFVLQELQPSMFEKLVGRVVAVSDPRRGGFPAGF